MKSTTKRQQRHLISLFRKSTIVVHISPIFLFYSPNRIILRDYYMHKFSPLYARANSSCVCCFFLVLCFVFGSSEFYISISGQDFKSLCSEIDVFLFGEHINSLPHSIWLVILTHFDITTVILWFTNDFYRSPLEKKTHTHRNCGTKIKQNDI